MEGAARPGPLPRRDHRRDEAVRRRAPRRRGVRREGLPAAGDHPPDGGDLDLGHRDRRRPDRARARRSGDVEPQRAPRPGAAAPPRCACRGRSTRRPPPRQPAAPVAALVSAASAVVADEPLARLEYIEVFDPATLGLLHDLDATPSPRHRHRRVVRRRAPDRQPRPQLTRVHAAHPGDQVGADHGPRELGLEAGASVAGERRPQLRVAGGHRAPGRELGGIVGDEDVDAVRGAPGPRRRGSTATTGTPRAHASTTSTIVPEPERIGAITTERASSTSPRSRRVGELDAVQLDERRHPVRVRTGEHDPARREQLAQRRQHVEREPLGGVLVRRVQERAGEHEVGDGELVAGRGDDARVVDAGAHAVGRRRGPRPRLATVTVGRGGRRSARRPAAEAALDLAGQAEHARVDAAVVGDAPPDPVRRDAGELAPVAARQVDVVDDRPILQPLGDGEEGLGPGTPDDVRLVVGDHRVQPPAGRSGVDARRWPRPPRAQRSPSARRHRVRGASCRA